MAAASRRWLTFLLHFSMLGDIAHAFTPAQIAWQQDCIRKHIYDREARREILQRFGISIEVPPGMDFDISQAPEPSSAVSVVEIEGLALTRCIRIAKQLHGIDLPGRGLTSLSLEQKDRSPRPSSDEFVDAVVVLGKKRPVYSDGIEIWTTLASPNTGQPITVSAFEFNERDFLVFLKRIQASPYR